MTDQSTSKEWLRSLGNAIATSGRDWSTDRRDAWIYGIVLGWPDDAMAELSLTHGWSFDEVSRLRRLHAERIAHEPPADALAVARRFHEAYERLAPSFGYETRTETRVFDPESKNGRLMVAVCAEIGTSQPPSDALNGYVKAFYQIAEMLDLEARPESPEQVFQTVMLPKLRELIDRRAASTKGSGHE